MPTYNSYITGGSNVTWLAGPWSSGLTINLFGSLARVDNPDGSWTVFHGDIGGFKYNEFGGVDGTIRWITHTTAGTSFGDVTELEAIGGVFDHLNIEFSSWLGTGTTLYSLVHDRTGLVLNGDGGDNLLGGGKFGDVFNGFAGNDTASYRRAAGSVTADLAGLVAHQGAAAGDVFSSIENLEGSRNGPGDLLLGDNNANTLSGLAGDDTLAGRDGTDILDGGTGNDVLIGGNGDDNMNGDEGVDELNYSDATTSIFVILDANGSGTATTLSVMGTDTFSNFENVRGGSGNDTFYGNDLDNALIGEGGNDDLKGNGGADFLRGGDGNDVLEGGFGNDTIDGGSGVNTIFYANNSIGWVNIALLDGGATFTANTEFGGQDTFSNITNVQGSFSSDTITGNSDGNALYGNSGNDNMMGGSGNDLIDAGEGDDIVFGDVDFGFQDGNQAYGDDTVLGGAGNDTLYGGNGTDSFNGGSGNDRLTYEGYYDDFGNGEYFIHADLSSNTVVKYFLGYFDSTTYHQGTDTVTGSGADAVESITTTGSNDIIIDGFASGNMSGLGGNDIYRPIADGLADFITDSAGFDTLRFDLATKAVTVNLTGAGTGTSKGGGIGATDFNGIEKIDLSGFGDIVLAGVGVASGNDTINGQGGNDVIEGGAGADALEGWSGIDTLSYQSSGAGVTVNLTSNTVGGGDAAGDTIINFENVIGSAFGDALTGNGGRNVLTGNFGADILRGGRGRDVFIFNKVADSTTSKAGRDVIRDFNANDTDQIDLAAIDAVRNSGTANDQFGFIGGALFTAAGQVRAYASGNNTFVDINTGGTLAADMRIVLSGAVALDADDFRL